MLLYLLAPINQIIDQGLDQHTESKNALRRESICLIDVNFVQVVHKRGKYHSHRYSIN